VATSLLAIASEFQSLEMVNWVALAYTLTLLGFAIVFTQLADGLGRRSAYMLAYAIVFAASLGCGFAQSMQQLIALRALQGVGGAGECLYQVLHLVVTGFFFHLPSAPGLMSLTLVIFPEVSPIRYAHHIGTLCGVVVAGAGILGPTLGGVFAHLVTWRWIFWIKFVRFPLVPRAF